MQALKLFWLQLNSRYPVAFRRVASAAADPAGQSTERRDVTRTSPNNGRRMAYWTGFYMYVCITVYVYPWRQPSWIQKMYQIKIITKETKTTT